MRVRSYNKQYVQTINLIFFIMILLLNITLYKYNFFVILIVFRYFSGINHIFVNPELGLNHLRWSSYFLESRFKVKSTPCGHHLKLEIKLKSMFFECLVPAPDLCVPQIYLYVLLVYQANYEHI